MQVFMGSAEHNSKRLHSLHRDYWGLVLLLQAVWRWRLQLQRVCDLLHYLGWLGCFRNCHVALCELPPNPAGCASG